MRGTSILQGDSPFGEEVPAGLRNGTPGYATADNVRQKFTGYEHDGETGLEFAQARYHAAVQGRFTSADPLMSSGDGFEPQSWNRYSYVINSPLVLTDPLGLSYTIGGGVEDLDIDELSSAAGQQGKPKKNPLMNPPGVDPDSLPPGVTVQWVVAYTWAPSGGTTFGPGSNGTGGADYTGSVSGMLGGSGQSYPGFDRYDVSMKSSEHFRGASMSINASVLKGFGLTVHVRRDSYQNWYVSSGPSVGIGLLPVTGALYTGRVAPPGPGPIKERDVIGVLTGPSAGITTCGLVVAPPYTNFSWNTGGNNIIQNYLGYYGPPLPTGGASGSAGISTPQASWDREWGYKIPWLKW